VSGASAACSACKLCGMSAKPTALEGKQYCRYNAWGLAL